MSNTCLELLVSAILSLILGGSVLIAIDFNLDPKVRFGVGGTLLAVGILVMLIAVACLIQTCISRRKGSGQTQSSIEQSLSKYMPLQGMFRDAGGPRFVPIAAESI